MKNSTASTIIFLSTSTVVSAYQVRHGPWTVAFVLFACMDLLALFVCLRALKKLRPEDGMKESSKVAIWVFGNALNGAFAYPVAQMMPLALYVAVWGMSGFTIIVTFYGLFVYREPENLKNNDADMADFPSQAGQERGLAYDKRLALASVGHPESAAPPMIDAGQTANQIISGRNLATGSRSTKRGGVESPTIIVRTESEVDTLDDGFKWRWNGRKRVKNSSYPRTYYRCSTEGCSVEKRVQRDKEDPSYVMTTYVGRHNHEPWCCSATQESAPPGS